MKKIRVLRNFTATHIVSGLAYRFDKAETHDHSASVSLSDTYFTVGQIVPIKEVPSREGDILVAIDGERFPVLDREQVGQDYVYVENE